MTKILVPNTKILKRVRTNKEINLIEKLNTPKEIWQIIRGKVLEDV